MAGELFGDQPPIGENVSVAGIYYKVVGVAGERSENMSINGSLDQSITIPLSTMRGAYNLGDEVELALFLAHDGVKMADVRPRIERILRSHHPIHPDDRKAIGFMDISEVFAMVDNLFTGINLLAIFVGVSTLLAGIIGIGNIMWVIVKERTQEIGIRRAIGAKPRDIIVQILSEGMALTVIAGVAGICFAAGSAVCGRVVRPVGRQRQVAAFVYPCHDHNGYIYPAWHRRRNHTGHQGDAHKAGRSDQR